MQQALAEHNKGNLRDAERVYREVLKVVPAHISANHNLAELVVDLHQSNNALPFLVNAFEGNSKVEQFWVSYINALINLDKLGNAKEFIQIASKAGFSAENSALLLLRTVSPVILQADGRFVQAQDGNYLSFLRALNKNIYEGYFDIGAHIGAFLILSQSPSIAIDPFFQLEKIP